VSRICQRVDEKLDADWTVQGVGRAVKIILEENSSLFDDHIKNLENNPDLYHVVYDIVINGNLYPYNADNPLIALGAVYGIFKGAPNVQITNQIFTIRFANYFISKNTTNTTLVKDFGVVSGDVVQNGKFNMELCLTKFAQHYAEIYSEKNTKFLEEQGRMILLTYLKALINGVGFYHMESQLTDLRRMDLVVDYGRDQFVLELKIWHGEQKHQDAYAQLAGYLETKQADTGYLLTFDFRKGAVKEPKAEWVEFGGKRIFDVMV
jgi:hypothetical protein